jgi:tetratricopeptide (TPR) repeat protein
MAIPQDVYRFQSSLSAVFDRIGLTQEISDDLSFDELSSQEQDQISLLIDKFESVLEDIRQNSTRLNELLDQRLLIRLGNYYYLQNDDAQALEYYSLSNQVAENEWAYYNTAIILVATKQFDRAYENFTQAITLKPDFPQALRHQAVILNLQGKKDAALKKLKESQQLNPNDPETNKLLADYYLEEGEKKEALMHLKSIHHRDEEVIEKIDQLERKKAPFQRVLSRFRKK